MSLNARIQIHGSTVTVKRATKSQSAGGSTNQSWAAVSGLSDVKMLLNTPTPEIAQRIFGQETRVEVMAFVPNTYDVQPGDGIIVTAGWKSGTRFAVQAAPEFDQGRNHAHKELALVSSPAGSFE
jgi:hypothetical protein